MLKTLEQKLVVSCYFEMRRKNEQKTVNKNAWKTVYTPENEKRVKIANRVNDLVC